MSFLNTQVSKSDKDAWKKLKRGLVRVNNTIENKHVTEARSFSKVFTWIDVEYMVNNNNRRHIGGSISMGYGIIHGKH